MTGKDRVLALLLEADGEAISGQEMAEKLQISRSAVWKSVKVLQKEGYRIQGVTNKGYVLLSESEKLSEAAIRKYLGKKYEDCRLCIYGEVVSTNRTLRELADEGAKEGTVVLAKCQTEGRGRRGREFYSPADTGLYMSILLRPQMGISDLMMVTAASAAATAEAVEAITGTETAIKWVNDVYAKGKKVSGILTEASFSLENGSIDFLIVGIGVNVLEPEGGFPESIQGKAGAVCQRDQCPEGIRNVLAAEIIKRVLSYYRTLPERTFYPSYKEKMLWMGEKIFVHTADKKKPAIAVGIDDRCSLRVRYEDGTEEILRTGEISVSHPDR